MARFEALLLSLSVSLSVSLSLSACGPDPDLALADVPLAERPIVAAFPPQGALNLWGDVPVAVALGTAADAGAIEVHVTRATGTAWYPCALEYGATMAYCGVIPDLAPGEAVTLDVQLDDVSVHHEAEGRLPAPGLGWDLLDGVAFTAAGGREDAPGLLNDLLGRTMMFAALDGYDGTPGRWPFVLSPSGLDAAGEIGVAPWGFGFVVPVDVAADGAVRSAARTAWLTVQVGADPALLLLLDVEMTGRIDGDALSDLVMTAALPAVSVESLAQAAGLFGPQVVERVQLDLDLDGDGTAEAAALRLEGDPAPAALRAWGR